MAMNRISAAILSVTSTALTQALLLVPSTSRPVMTSAIRQARRLKEPPPWMPTLRYSGRP